MASDDYYSILNIPKTANEDEIKQSFRRLSILYHPDKHIDPVKKAAAEQIFQKINTAYSVLISEHTRSLYDELGEEGIKAMWQVGPYTGQYNEKQRILEAIQRRDGQRMMRVDARSTVVAGFDASTWIDDYSALGPLGVLDYIPMLASMNLAQTFHTWLTPETSSGLTFDLATENGRGEGTAQFMLAQEHSATTRSEATISFGRHRSLSVGAYSILDKRTVLNGRLTGLLQNGQFLPVIQTGLSRQIFGVPTSANLAVGAQNSVTIQAAWVEEDGMSDSKATLQLSPQGNLAKYSSNVGIRPGLSVGLRMKLATHEMSVAVGLSKVWSSLYSSGAFLNCHFAEGVALHLSLTRKDDFKFVMPLKLSHEVSPTTILIGSAIPAVFTFLLDRFIVSPLQRYLSAKQIAKEIAEHKRHLEEQSLEAALIAHILEPAYRKRVKQEKLIDGLILTKAIYKSQSAELDVQIPLQVLIIDSQLVISGGIKKAGLLGFYNIDPEHPKTLHLEYSFKGSQHRVELADQDPVMLPARHHKV